MPNSLLLKALESCEVYNVTTFLQSGNFAFQSNQPPAQLELQIEEAVKGTAGITTSAFVRSKQDVANVLDSTLCKDFAPRNPSRTLIYFCKDLPHPEWNQNLPHEKLNGEVLARIDHCILAFYPISIADSKLTALTLERAVGSLVTGRNYSTLTKLIAMLG